jgi:hypothetical protein
LNFLVGQDAADGDPQAGEICYRLAKKGTGRSRFFIGQHGGEGDAGVIVDGHVEELPARAAGFILGISGQAMTGLMNLGQFFDVEVQQIAGSRMFVAEDGDQRFEHAGFVQSQAGEDAADGSAAQARGLCDAHSGPALAAQALHAANQFGGSSTRRAQGAGTTIPQRGATAQTKTLYPLGSGLSADLVLGRGRVQGQLPLQNPLCELLSTVNGESRMMVVVHSVSWSAFASQHQLPSSRPNGQQPLETSQLKPHEDAQLHVGAKACLPQAGSDPLKTMDTNF